MVRFFRQESIQKSEKQDGLLGFWSPVTSHGCAFILLWKILLGFVQSSFKCL